MSLRALLAGLVLLASCSAPPAPGPLSSGVPTADGAPGTADPRGQVRVAYAQVPSAWVVAEGDDPAATDLAALWGLPLYRIGPRGHLRPALVAEADVATTEDGTVVDLQLRPGRWSDGRPVVAEDVVATLRGLRDGARAAELAPLKAVTAPGPRHVRLRFDRPYARWPYLLADTGGVLPAHVLERSGLGAYEDDVPVAGGWFRLREQEPGRHATFVAHTGGPLGPPALERLTVLFVPDYETALGLLEDGEVEATVGHLALNPEGRAGRIEDVTGGAPLGGTWVGIAWRRGGPMGGGQRAPARRAVDRAVDTSHLVEGLLDGIGEEASSPVPGIPGPPTPPARVPPPGGLVLVAPDWHEVLGPTSRALRTGVRGAGGSLEVVWRDTPSFVAAARSERDGALRVYRDSPRPSLVPHLGAGEPALTADATTTGRDQPALEAAARLRLTSPLYRVGVAHAWRTSAVSLRPSSWPGVGLWDAGRWQRQEGRGGA